MLRIFLFLCGCSNGDDQLVTMSFLRVMTNVYMVGYSQLQFPGLSARVGEISNMFDISTTVSDPCNRP